MTVEKGRPQSSENRLEKEMRAYDLLDSLGIEYERVDHEPAMTMQACREIDLALDVDVCKNLFLTNRQGTAFYLLLIPGDKQFKTKDISAQIGSARLSFASGEAMERMIDITPGSLTVLGLMNDPDREVTLLIDEDVLREEYFGCHPCINTSTVRFRISDLTERLIPALGHTPIRVSLPTYTEE